MKTFLLCGGVYGETRGLDWLRRIVEARPPDGILFAGGVLNESRNDVENPSPGGMRRDEALFVERFFETLGKLGVWSAVIPGSFDTPLEEFLGLGMHAEVDFPGVHIVHATLVTHGDVAVTGLGGWVSEGPACEAEPCSRAMAQYHLRALNAAKQPHTALLLARPPVGRLGNVGGSVLSGELIDSLRPSVCVAGDGSPEPAIERVAHSLVVTPGFLSDGRAAWLDWRRPPAERVELLNLAEAITAGVPT
jgi:Metallophosphoesterase, calcineurin superfamily